MKFSKQSLVADLSPFADIGSGELKASEKGGQVSIKIHRDSRELKVFVDLDSGASSVSIGKNSRNYGSFSELLASEYFANLRKWADAQKEVLSKVIPSRAKLIPLNARASSGEQVSSADEALNLVVARRELDCVRILLLDGPAGIGKTGLIEQMALRRAESFKEKGEALILHVKSRGRVLSNLQDLMAFSLQTIRSHITYDQVPALVKHGLIILAIDGFDELGDPNGYELAWAQLSELVDSVRGNGIVILAGRDTFFGKSSILRDVRAIKQEVDEVVSLSILPPSEEKAREWLLANGWSEAGLRNEAVSVLLEEGSYALRPMFLRLIAENIRARDVQGKSSGFLTPTLLTYVIRREAALFGKAVDSVMSRSSIEEFLWKFLKEVARDMADSQTEALDSSSLQWIAEVSLPDDCDSDVAAIIKNRASVIALLSPDERPGFRSFAHSYLMNYFLSLVAIDTLSAGEIPKFVRRNLLGAEFLSVFSDTSSHVGSQSPERIDGFFKSMINYSHRPGSLDRSSRNVGALLLSSLPESSAFLDLPISDYQVDDVVMRGTAAGVSVERVVVNQVDARGADISEVKFSDCSVVRLIGDDSTRLPPRFPLPKVVITQGGGQLSEAEEILAWAAMRGAVGDGATDVSDARKLRESSLYKLLGKACRLRQYWLREEDDVYAERILRDDNWPVLQRILAKHGFLRVEDRPAAGRIPSFVHIRQKQRLISEDHADFHLREFYADLVKESA